MRLVIISDTHGSQPTLPDGDVLIHCGDATMNGTEQQFRDFTVWYATRPHDTVIYIPGNHDFICQDFPEHARRLAEDVGINMLVDQEMYLGDFKVYGSPWQPWFHDWAFNLPRDDAEAAIAHWPEIPRDTDILVTHGPPLFIRDQTLEGEHVGCPHLGNRVEAVQPLIHAFGHIHEGYGQSKIGPTTYINASSLNRKYQQVNAPIVVDL